MLLRARPVVLFTLLAVFVVIMLGLRSRGLALEHDLRDLRSAPVASGSSVAKVIEETQQLGGLEFLAVVVGVAIASVMAKEMSGRLAAARRQG